MRHVSEENWGFMLEPARMVFVNETDDMVANDQFHNFHGSNIKRQKKKLQLRGNCCAAFVHSYHTGVKIELYLG